MYGFPVHHASALEANNGAGLHYVHAQCLKTFSTQYLFTQGGAPMEPINVITLNLYYTTIRDRNIGLASAMSIILFCMMLFFTWLQFKTSRSEEVDY